MATYTLNWSISRARDTEGYNVLTARDSRGRKVAGCCGGGYDMEGTVFAEILTKHHLARIASLAAIGAYCEPGLIVHADGSWYLDGACGLDSMVRIARAAGLTVESIRAGRKCRLVGWAISEGK
jgi:hypothetical protein